MIFFHPPGIVVAQMFFVWAYLVDYQIMWTTVNFTNRRSFCIYAGNGRPGVLVNCRICRAAVGQVACLPWSIFVGSAA